MENESNNIIEKENKPKTKSIILNSILILVIFIGLFIYMVNIDGIDNIIYLLNQLDYFWVFIGIICLIIYWLCESLELHLPLKKLYKNQNFFNSIKVSMIGQLFNNITPFASGGQPMQAYELTKTKKRVSDSMSVLAIKFIITQTALVLTTMIVVLFKLDFFIEILKDYIWVAIIGFIINIFAILVVILAGLKKEIITFFTTPIIKLLGKLHIFKDPNKTIEKLDESIENFRKQFKFIKSEKLLTLKVFLIASIQSFAYYSLTYVVYRAFGNSGVSFFEIIPIQALLLLIMTFIPTPGSGLGAEGGFYLLFNSIFKKRNNKYVYFILENLHILLTNNYWSTIFNSYI